MNLASLRYLCVLRCDELKLKLCFRLTSRCSKVKTNKTIHDHNQRFEETNRARAPAPQVGCMSGLGPGDSRDLWTLINCPKFFYSGSELDASPISARGNKPRVVSSSLHLHFACSPESLDKSSDGTSRSEIYDLCLLELAKSVKPLKIMLLLLEHSTSQLICCKHSRGWPAPESASSPLALRTFKSSIGTKYSQDITTTPFDVHDTNNIVGSFWSNSLPAPFCQYVFTFTARDLTVRHRALFFLFYFNRLFATIVSYAIRTWTWHNYRVSIHIGSLQFSLLAGRVFFNNVRYQGSNETILISSGHVTWRYWLRKVQHVDSEDDKPSATGSLPCRILLRVSGVEWFIYNRSPVYDGIVNAMASTDAKEDSVSHNFELDAEKKKTERHDAQSSTSSPPLSKEGDRDLEHTAGTTGSEKGQQARDEARAGPDASSASFLSMLPISISCTKGAIVMGNNNTPAILVAHWSAAEGSVDAAKVNDFLPSFLLL